MILNQRKKRIEYDTFNLSSSVDNTSKTVKENCREVGTVAADTAQRFWISCFI